jgi:lambda family phage portal protein
MVDASKLPVVRQTLVDRAVAYFFPRAALDRMRARTHLAVAGQYLGGSIARRQTAGWLPFGGSADRDAYGSLKWLRNRSRDMQRNQPIARGAVNTVVTTAAGTGLALRVRVKADELGMSEEEARAWRQNTEREFALWACNPSMCDAERTLDFYALQGLAFRSALESGDVFAALPWRQVANLPYQLKVQLIEADRVVNKDYAAETDTLNGGVERDSFGAPVAYHILRTHPGGLGPPSLVWDVVPAFGGSTGRRNIVHLFDKLRPGQGRGVPYLSPVIESLKQLADYTDGELRAALISSLFTVFVTSKNGNFLDPDQTGASATSPQQTGDDIKLGSGSIVGLAPGEEISTAAPGRPNVAFDPFVTAVLRQVGVALELPFELLVKHFTSSYSAARAALLEAWRFFKSRRTWLASMFCQPVYEAWMDEAVARGRVSAPGYFDDAALRAAYLRCNWIGDAQGQIDPLKEVQAIKQRLSLLLTTFSDETAALTGEDWEDVAERRSGEEKVIDAMGLRPVLVDPGQDPTQTDPDDPDAVPQQAPPSNTPGKQPAKPPQD